MFIKMASAAVETANGQIAPGANTSLVTTPAAGGAAFSQTILFTVVLVILFYVLLIRPQQKRYKEHSAMLNKLGLGDKIVTQGGMIGTIDSLPSEKEAVVDFGNNIKMTVLRSSVMGKYDGLVKNSDTAKKTK